MKHEITYENGGTYVVNASTESEYMQQVKTLEECGMNYISQNDNGYVLLAEMNASGGYSYIHR